MKRFNQDGTHAIVIVLVLLFVAVAGLAGWKVLHRDTTKSKPSTQTTTNTQQPQTTTAQTASSITWMQTEDGFKPSSTPPTCPDKIVKQFPADITQATSVLYPGQFRGGNYKPHGGLRFDKATSNNISVKAPFDGKIIDGAAYLAEGSVNDVQYTFDVMNDCGMMFRVGHLLTLSPQLAEIAKAFPAPVKGDSHTTKVTEVAIKAGTELATAVGTATDKNVFFDWGVYDWRKPNVISTDATWLQNSQHSFPLAKHAICWFGQLSSKDEAIIRALPPGDPASGKTSDYCE